LPVAVDSMYGAALLLFQRRRNASVDDLQVVAAVSLTVVPPRMSLEVC
jgi:hypothetical protein